VLVITGAGRCVLRRHGPEEFFHELKEKPKEYNRVSHGDRMAVATLRYFPKPTIAMVTVIASAVHRIVESCDLAFRRRRSQDGTVEINFKGFPAAAEQVAGEPVSTARCAVLCDDGPDLRGEEAARIGVRQPSFPLASSSRRRCDRKEIAGKIRSRCR